MRLQDANPEEDPQTAARLLPGEEQVIQGLVDQAVVDINAIQRGKSLEACLLIGEYLLEVFFEGDPVAFRERSDRHASFGALARRTGLEMSATSLWTSVAVVQQLRELPPEVGRCLPLSHHRLLLPIEDRALKCQLARMAVEGGFSKRRLESELRRRCPRRKSKAGRPAYSPYVRSLLALRNAAREVAALSAEELDRGRYSFDAFVGLVDETDRLLDAIRGRIRRSSYHLVSSLPEQSSGQL